MRICFKNINITSDLKDDYKYDIYGRLTSVNYDQVNIPQYNGDKIERFFYDNVGNRTSQENYTLKDITTETCTDEIVVEDIVLPNGKPKMRGIAKQERMPWGTVEKKFRTCETTITQVEKEKNTIVYDSNTLNQYTKLQNLNKNDEVKKEFTYVYDNNGNLSKDDINGYFYDYKNRLVKVIQNEVYKVDELGNIIEIIPEVEIVNYEYDILGRRITKTTEDKTTQFIYAGQQAIQENTYSFSGTELILQETRENIYSNNLDDILSTTVTDYTTETPTTNQYYYEKNHLGSITKITDTTGAIIEQYEYDVFGVAYANVNNVEAITNAPGHSRLSIKNAKGSETNNAENSEEIIIDNIRYKRYNGIGRIGNTRLYTGREYDSELKLYYNRARYYSPDLGRFISRDPIDISDDVNLYGYVGNNGVMFVDRMGKQKNLIANFYRDKLAEEFKIEFVSAYDNYLSLKKSIYGVLPGSYDLDFVELSAEEQQNKLQELYIARGYAKELHYGRNQFQPINTLPKTDEEALKEGWNKLSNRKAVLHQIDVPKDDWNEKWVSGNGKKEVIYLYNTNGDIIVTKTTNMGTYNFYSPDNYISHINYDVKPYIEWGNGLDDTSNLNQRSSWTRGGVIRATK